MSVSRLLPAGEGAVSVEFGAAIAPELNDRVRRLHSRLAADPPRGFSESIPAFSSLLACFDPLATDADEFSAAVSDLAFDPAGEPPPPGRELEIPAAYGGEFGPDLGEVAARAGLREEQVVALHAHRSYRVYMLGFLAGFPYLAPVDERIAASRRADPRLRVPAGSIGLAGRQTGIYPLEAPGGWQLVARTPLRLWDPARHPPAAFRPGDRVRFFPVTPAEFVTLTGDVPWPSAGRPAPAVEPPGPDREVFRVVAGGPLTTIQDRGRPGYQEYGVPPGGALDDVSLRVANRLAGNATTAAALEVTGAGLELEALAPVGVGLAGADLDARVNGEPFRAYSRRAVAPGDRLRFGIPRSGVRCYLAVSGGLAVPPVLGSRCTYLPARLGGLEGRALRAGDALRAYLGPELPPPAGEVPAALRVDPRPTLRLVPGPQAVWLTAEGWTSLVGQTFSVGAASGRMGLRMEGGPVVGLAAGDLVSDGVPPGALQILPGGQPVLLLADRQTTGGYPKPAVVARVDLPAAGQLLPGAPVRFALVDLAEARRLLRERERVFAAWAGLVRELRLTVDGRPFRVTVEDLEG